MKKLTYFYVMLFLCNFSAYSCEHNLLINKDEKHADSLALEIAIQNTFLLIEWDKTIDLHNQKTSLIEYLINLVQDTLNNSSELNALSLSLQKFKSIKKPSTIISNEELFSIYSENIDDITQKYHFFYDRLKRTNKLVNQTLKITDIIKDIGNKISVQRYIYNNSVQNYNLKIKEDANAKFFEKYPHLGYKYQFKVNEKVKFTEKSKLFKICH